jgi:hypothetical protein
MKYLRRTAGYTLLNHKRNEDDDDDDDDDDDGRIK